MDFRDTPEEAEFRTEVSEWLDRALKDRPPPGDDSQDRERASRWWQETLHEGGWAGITYPEEYGGRGLSIVYEAIFNQEAALRDAPTPINLLGNILAGPTILVYGTEDQKHRFIPRILSGEDVWCQGFSEPNAGSDLAGLRTRAREAEGGFVVTGQKVWTSFGHAADRCMLLARTGPALDEADSKHAGITYFCAPMDEVEVRPLVMINGDADFNEMFFEDVFVADEDVLGEVGNGWKVGLTTLAFERGSLAFVTSVRAQRILDLLVERIRDQGLQDDAVLADRVGDLHARVESVRLGTIRQLSRVSSGETPGAEGSALKLSWAAVMQDITRLAVELGGQAGIVLDADDAGRWPNGYLRARGNSIEGGTDEIQRSIIAERVLGLPRSR